MVFSDIESYRGREVITEMILDPQLLLTLNRLRCYPLSCLVCMRPSIRDRRAMRAQ